MSDEESKSLVKQSPANPLRPEGVGNGVLSHIVSDAVSLARTQSISGSSPGRMLNHSQPGGSGKSMVILVGSDKGGVGKTTVSRALLDLLDLNDIKVNALDTDAPRGALHRFYPEQTLVVNLTSRSERVSMKDILFDPRAVTVIDVGPGALRRTLEALDDLRFFESVKSGRIEFVFLHLFRTSSISSLDEIAQYGPYGANGRYIIVENHMSEFASFEWDRQAPCEYLANKLAVPFLSCGQLVEIAGTPFSTFIANLTAAGKPADHNFTLRGYVRTWLARLSDDLERLGLIDLANRLTKATSQNL